MVTIKFIFLKMNKKKKIPFSDQLAQQGRLIPWHIQGLMFEPLYSRPLFAIADSGSTCQLCF